MIDTEAQRVASGADLGVLVVKRPGHADPGRWWAWFPLERLLFDALTVMDRPAPCGPLGVPVRLELGHLVPILQHWGYGTETAE